MGLYNSGMATDYPTIGITQSGSSGNYSYSVTGSYSQGVNCPIFDVSWGDAARFCNWLQNGQPDREAEKGRARRKPGRTRSTATTSSALMAITRNTGATYFIPIGKRMVQGGVLQRRAVPTRGYWTYPTQSNTAPSNMLSATRHEQRQLLRSIGTGTAATPTRRTT